MPPLQSSPGKHKFQNTDAAPPRRRTAALSESIDIRRSDIIRLK